MPLLVPITALKRIPPGPPLVVPDDMTKMEMRDAHWSTVQGRFRFCIDDAGRVTIVDVVQSTRLLAYDRKIIGWLKAAVYEPYRDDVGTAPVCSFITFRYSQR